MNYTGVFVDDNSADSRQYSRILSKTVSNQSLTITPVNLIEAAQLAAQIYNAKPDIAILDFRLDDNLGDVNIGFKGSSLAQHLRDAIISNMDSPTKNDFPIVLISAESNLEKLYCADKTAHDLFDNFYSKEVLNGDTSIEVVRQLISLCEGYKTLNTIWKSNNKKLSIFSEVEDIQEVVNHQEITFVLDNARAPHIAARFIMKYIIQREGLLYSRKEIAAKLGIYQEDFGQPIIDWLEQHDCFYKDIFSTGWERWWSHRVDIAIQQLIGQRPMTLSAIERVSIINNKLGLTLQPAKSQFSDSADEKFMFACACCTNPTEVKHSLAVFDPQTPRFVQKKRICWGCVRDDRSDGTLVIEESDLRFVTRIKTS